LHQESPDASLSDSLQFLPQGRFVDVSDSNRPQARLAAGFRVFTADASQMASKLPHGALAVTRIVEINHQIGHVCVPVIEFTCLSEQYIAQAVRTQYLSKVTPSSGAMLRPGERGLLE
jgi:hypothetical protein